MRYSNIPSLLLLVARFLVVAGIAVGSPAIKNQHERSFEARSISEPSSDDPNRHAVARMNAPEWGQGKMRRIRDTVDPANHDLSPALIQRHNYIMDQLRLHSGDSSLAKRSLAGDLTIMGFRLIWDQADVIVSSTLAYYRTTEYYKNITMLMGTEFSFGPIVQNHIITYGVFRLTFAPMAGVVAAIASDLAAVFPNGFGQFLQEFAEVMLAITTVVVIATYRILAFSVTASIWITMVIVENADLRDMVTGR